MAEAIVVGAGQSGLIVGELLARHGVRTALVERLPAAGGQEPEGAPERRLEASARAAGVHLRLGTFAVRWREGQLDVLGVDGAECLRGDALVLATGSRPATRGELGIAGDRCAGVVPGSAAVHLTESGVLLGHAPVVVGGGTLAGSCAAALVDAGARSVTVVAAEPPTVALPAAARVMVGWRVRDVHGPARVAAVTIGRGERRERLLADALVLAEGRLPMRNVEGAVVEGGSVVACHSAGEPKSEADARATADAALERTLALLAAPRPAADMVTGGQEV